MNKTLTAQKEATVLGFNRKPKGNGHTRGPWKFGNGFNGYIDIDGPASGWAGLAKVVWEMEEGSSDEAQANAKLIVAAPELLQACKGAIAQFNDQMFIWGKDDDKKVCLMMRDLALAIKKAEGN